MTKDVFDEYGNYKYPDYSNSQYTHDVSTTGGALKLIVDISPEDYECLKSYREFYDTSGGRILKAVCNGKDAMAVIAEVTATELTEIQTEIEEKVIRKQGIDSGFEYDYEFIQSEEVVEIIQQKIDKLRVETEEKK